MERPSFVFVLFLIQLPIRFPLTPLYAEGLVRVVVITITRYVYVKRRTRRRAI
jgi:putative flippase GtrA